MKAIVVTDEAAGAAGMTLVERPEPPAAINDVIVQVHASGFVPTEIAWPSTWTDRQPRPNAVDPWARAGRSGHVPRVRHDGGVGGTAGVRPRGVASRRHPGGVCGDRGAQPRAAAGRCRLHGGREPANLGADGVAGTVRPRPPSGRAASLRTVRPAQSGRWVTQLAREAGAYVIGTGRAADRQKALDFGAQEFVALDNDALEDVGRVDLVFDVIGGNAGPDAGRLPPGAPAASGSARRRGRATRSARSAKRTGWRAGGEADERREEERQERVMVPFPESVKLKPSPKP